MNLIGHLTRTPEKRQSNGGTTIVKTGIAVNGWKEGDVLFIDVTAFNKTAEAMMKLSKGQAVSIVGRLQLETWDDKNGGGKRSKHSVIADQIVFLGGGKATLTNEPEQVAEPEVKEDGEIPF